ncbi:hypothetical protein GAY21_23450 [Phocaeicola vulgatus]|nr:hypothetical protein GAY21_23450 [Phocaeicola vulgatus]
MDINMTIQPVQFIEAKEKTPRPQLELPRLHFVVMDDWVEKIGEKALLAWLKFYTWCDRSNSKREVDAIPTSMNKVAKKLSVGKDTLYNLIIKPLWNYGLIDLHPIVINGNVCVNIIVYKYPQNNKKLETEPLEKVRDYDTDYDSTAKENGKKGGRPKRESTSKEIDPSASRVVLNENQGGSEREPGVVLNENQGGSEREPNNSFKYLSNSSKSLSNSLKYLSNLSSEKVKNWMEKQFQNDRLTDDKAQIILDLYEEMKLVRDFSDVFFINVCSNVLDYKQDNFKSYLKKSLHTALIATQQQEVEQQQAATTEHSNGIQANPAYTVIAPLLPKLTDLPKSVKWQTAITAVQNAFNLNWDEARSLVEELNIL